MNMTMVDITDLPEVSLGEEVVLIGRSLGESITADDLAAQCATINYEIIARLGRHIPRTLRAPHPD